MKKIVSLLCVAALSMMLVACGSKSKNVSGDDIYSTWMDDVGATYEELTLNEDGSFARTTIYGIETNNTTGIFAFDGELIVLNTNENGLFEYYDVSFKKDKMIWTDKEGNNKEYKLK